MAVSSLAALGWAVEEPPSTLISVLASNMLWGRMVNVSLSAAQGLEDFLVLGLFHVVCYL